MVEKRILEETLCPKCKRVMSLARPSLFNRYDDGVGFGTPLVKICAHDDCPTFEAFICICDKGKITDQRPGWERNIYFLESGKYDEYRIGYAFTVISPDQIPLIAEEIKLEKIVYGIAKKELVDEKDISNLLLILTNESIGSHLRFKAGEILASKADLSAIDVIFLSKSANSEIATLEEETMKKIRDRYFIVCQKCYSQVHPMHVKSGTQICKSCS